MSYSIRIVSTHTPAIDAELYRLQKRCLPGDTRYDVRDGFWWIAYHGDTPVGFAGIVASSRWLETGYLCRAGVLEEHRGHGLQKRLIRVRLDLAKRVGWQWVLTDTRQNPPSANSLIACGFKMYDPRHPWAFKDSLYWRKKL